MSIIYILIARNSNEILCEYTECTGNFLQILRIILPKIFTKDNKSIITYDNYKIHILYANSYYFLSFSDDINDERIFNCLEDIKNEVFENINIEELNQIKVDKYIQGKNIIEKNIKNYNNQKEEIILEPKEDYVTKNINDIINSGLKTEIVINKNKNKNENEEDLLQINKNILKISDNFTNEETSRKNKYIILAAIIVGILIIIFMYIS